MGEKKIFRLWEKFCKITIWGVAMSSWNHYLFIKIFLPSLVNLFFLFWKSISRKSSQMGSNQIHHQIDKWSPYVCVEQRKIFRLWEKFCKITIWCVAISSWNHYWFIKTFFPSLVETFFPCLVGTFFSSFARVSVSVFFVFFWKFCSKGKSMQSGNVYL